MLDNIEDIPTTIGLFDRVTDAKLPIYRSRTPLYLKDCQNLSRGIYFSNYFLWFGKIREASMLPVLKRVSALLNSGEFGMVTNNSSLNILGDAVAGDIIETRFWVGEILDNNSTVTLFCDWRKSLDNNRFEIIAKAEMKISWVRIVDHGLVAVEPMPDYFLEYTKEMQSSLDNSPIFKEQKGDFDSLDIGERLYIAPFTPRRGRLLAKEYISTTLEDSNSVGNIYYSNYSRWQGVVRDNFFYNLAPEYFRGIGEMGELITTKVKVQHLREAMPFDKILITMNIIEVGQSGAELSFNYFKVEEGQNIKLAIGSQTVIWAKKSSDDKFIATAWPSQFLDRLIEE